MAWSEDLSDCKQWKLGSTVRGYLFYHIIFRLEVPRWLKSAPRFENNEGRAVIPDISMKKQKKIVEILWDRRTKVGTQ